MIMYMSSVQIKCAFQRCFWKGKLEDYEDHLKECAAKELGNVQQNAEMTKTLDKQKLVIADLKKKVRDGMAIQASQKRSIGNLYQLLVSKGKEARELLATIKIKDKKNGKLLLEKRRRGIVVEVVSEEHKYNCDQNMRVWKNIVACTFVI